MEPETGQAEEQFPSEYSVDVQPVPRSSEHLADSPSGEGHLNVVDEFPSEYSAASVGGSQEQSEQTRLVHDQWGEDQVDALDQFCSEHSQDVAGAWQAALANDVEVGQAEEQFRSEYSADELLPDYSAATAGGSRDSSEQARLVHDRQPEDQAEDSDQFLSEDLQDVAGAGSPAVAYLPHVVAACTAAAAVAALIIIGFQVFGAPLRQPERTSASPTQLSASKPQPSGDDSGSPVQGIVSATTVTAPPPGDMASAVSVPVEQPGRLPDAPSRVTGSPSVTAVTGKEARSSSTRRDTSNPALTETFEAIPSRTGRGNTVPVTVAVVTTPGQAAVDTPVTGVREVLLTPPTAGVADAPRAPVSPNVPVATAAGDSPPVVAVPSADQLTATSIAGGTVSVAAAVTPTAAIERTLQRYQVAFSRLDVDAVRQVWPSVDGKALAKAFDQLRREDLRFQSCKVSVTGATAVASCGGTTEYVPKIGTKSPRVERRQWQIALHRNAEQWVIHRVDVSEQ